MFFTPRQKRIAEEDVELYKRRAILRVDEEVAALKKAALDKKEKEAK